MKAWVISGQRQLSGTVQLPPSKSWSIRALIMAGLAEGVSRLNGILQSPDALAAQALLSTMGAQFESGANGGLVVKGIGSERVQGPQAVDVRGSGLVLRFAIALAALHHHPWIITGDNNVRSRRPVADLVQALRTLGVNIRYLGEPGMAPVQVQGPLQAGCCELRGHDSQPVSALLLALSMVAGESEVRVQQPGEKPWIDMTLRWLQASGAQIKHDDYRRYRLQGPVAWSASEVHVPSDMSALAFPLVAGLITASTIAMRPLSFDSHQGDAAVVDVLAQMGGCCAWDPLTATLTTPGDVLLSGLEVDLQRMIDALPALAVAACFADGVTHLRGGSVAREKESDRLAVMAQELRRMGADIREEADGLIIRGHGGLKGAEVSSHGDQRVAMALAVAGLGAHGTTCVHDVACSKRTFPRFREAMVGIGASILDSDVP